MGFWMVVVRVVVLQDGSYLRRYFSHGRCQPTFRDASDLTWYFLGGVAWIVIVPGISVCMIIVLRDSCLIVS